jgi:predicted RNase H-like HicB family nuclease
MRSAGKEDAAIDDVVLDAVWLAGAGEPVLLGACCWSVPLTLTGAATLEPVGMSGVRAARIGPLEEDAHKHLVRSAIGRLRAAGLVKLVYGRCYKLTAKGWRRRCQWHELLPKEPVRLHVVLEESEGWWAISLPSVPGAHSQGRSVPSALRHLADVLHTFEGMRRDGLLGNKAQAAALRRLARQP